jgi:hypothetical protein
MSAGATESIVVVPFELVKIRLQDRVRFQKKKKRKKADNRQYVNPFFMTKPLFFFFRIQVIRAH